MDSYHHDLHCRQQQTQNNTQDPSYNNLAHSSNPPANTLSDAHRLLSVYPFASATPTSHVARHLNNLTLTSQTPAYLQQLNQARLTDAGLMDNGQPIGSWNAQAERAIAMVQEEERRYYPQSSYSHPQTQDLQHQPTDWGLPHAYQQPHEAPNSVPSTWAYNVLNTSHQQSPYPLPTYIDGLQLASMASSSLAHALDPVVLPSKPQPTSSPTNITPAAAPNGTSSSVSPTNQGPNEFFNNFLESKMSEIKREAANEHAANGFRSPEKQVESFPKQHIAINSAKSRPIPTDAPVTPSKVKMRTPIIPILSNKSKLQPSQTSPEKSTLVPFPASSPDPLNSPIPITPLKRKSVVHPESPSLKRTNSGLARGSSPLTSIGADSPTRSVTPTATPTTSSTLKSATLPRAANKARAALHGHGQAGSLSPTVLKGSSSSTKLIPYVEIPRKLNLDDSTFITPSQSPLFQRNNSFLNSIRTAESDDLGGYGTPMSSVLSSPTKSESGITRSTGLRDEREPLEKFTTLLEDVFEAEDSLDPSVFASDAFNSSGAQDLPLGMEFWSPLNSSAVLSAMGGPLLSYELIQRLAKTIRRVSRKSTKSKGGVMKSPPQSKAKGGMKDVDPQLLSRLLKILERSIGRGENCDIRSYFSTTSTSQSKTKGQQQDEDVEMTMRPPSPSSAPSNTANFKIKTSPSKLKKQKETEIVEDEPINELYGEELRDLSNALEMMKEAVAATECCLALLGGGDLAKQLYSEELITNCITLISHILTTLIYPLMECTSSAAASASSSTSTSYMKSLYITILRPACVHLRFAIQGIYTSLTALIPHLQTLSGGGMMSEGMVVKLVYIAIGPFFISDAGGNSIGGDEVSKVKKKKGSTVGQDGGLEEIFGRTTPMKVFRLDALSLLRNLFAYNPEQRSWIIEEILTSLIRLPDMKVKSMQFRLRSGGNIHIVSALLLQLVQTAAHDLRIEAQKVTLEKNQKAMLKKQESLESFSEEIRSGAGDSAALNETDYEEIQMYNSGLDSASKSARAILTFLTKRSSKGKGAKTSNDAEYRAIFDTFMNDLLTVLYWPEWPAAAFVLNIITRFMISTVDEPKFNAETNSLKALSLDHLGLIASKLRTCCIQANDNHEGNVLEPLEDIVSKGDVDSLRRLVALRKDISTHLSKRSAEDFACNSARELSAATWGQRLCLVMRDQQALQSESDDRDSTAEQVANAQLMIPVIKHALRQVWLEAPSDIFDVGSEQEITRIDKLAAVIGATQSLTSLVDAILNVVLIASDSSVVQLRTKALKALSLIVTSDPTVLRDAKVRHAIEGHLLDSSPAVRDATVELLGKYIIQSPQLADDYYEKVADRIADTGLGVRKRVIKLLKSLFENSNDSARRTDISTRVVLRILDEDDTVKDLAVKTIEDLWLSDPAEDAARLKSSASSAPTQYDVKVAFTTKASVIMTTIAKIRDGQVVEDLLHAIMKEKQGKENVHRRYAEICDAFIDFLVDGSDVPEHSVANCIKSTYYFSLANPSIITNTKASMLLPYLKGANTQEELMICDYLLKIFQICIPKMPKTSMKFASDLQQALQPMILKPSASGGLGILQESIACMCSLVHNLTHEYKILIGLLKSCLGRLRESLKKSVSELTEVANLRPLIGVISIVSLLVKYCDFDKLRSEHAEYEADISQIDKASITQHVYSLLLKVYDLLKDHQTGRNRLLPCLGFLFTAYPSLMTEDRSAVVMDQIFASGETDARAQLLRIMSNFLMAEMMKHSTADKANHGTNLSKKEVNMDELVGNTQGFADSGVSTAIVQRYLTAILKAALSRNPAEQIPALDLLGIIVKQGLAHPLQSMPVIVSLETSSVSRLSNRAAALHAVLHSKHASLVNTRFLDCAKTSFQYHSSVAGNDPVLGYFLSPDPTARLHSWYSLVRDKRQSRQDFVKAMMKSFDFDPQTNPCSKSDVDFVKYMTENVASLDYKTLEEVLTVIRQLTAVISVAGMYIMEAWTPTALDQLRIDDADEDIDMTSSPLTSLPSSSQKVDGTESPEAPLARTSVAVALTMQLKSHLKNLYSLSEEKCGKWVPNKKSTLGDKPAVKRHHEPISFERMPFVTALLLTESDVRAQKSHFTKLWQEDGVTAEPPSDIE